jgi:hypothetical protein
MLYVRDTLIKPSLEEFNYDVPIMLEITKSYADFTFPVRTVNNTAIKYHYCIEDEYHQFNKTQPMSLSISYLCLDLNILDPMYLLGNSKSYVNFINCTQQARYNIIDPRCKLTPPAVNEPIFFALNFIFKFYSEESIDGIETRVGYLEKIATYSKNNAFQAEMEVVAV